GAGRRTAAPGPRPRLCGPRPVRRRAAGVGHERGRACGGAAGADGAQDPRGADGPQVPRARRADEALPPRAGRAGPRRPRPRGARRGPGARLGDLVRGDERRRLGRRGAAAGRARRGRRRARARRAECAALAGGGGRPPRAPARRRPRVGDADRARRSGARMAVKHERAWGAYVDPPLRDKVAVVTGAAKGLGGAITDVLACDGAHLVLAGRDREALESHAVRLDDEYPERESLVAICDVTEED